MEVHGLQGERLCVSFHSSSSVQSRPARLPGTLLVLPALSRRNVIFPRPSPPSGLVTELAPPRFAPLGSTRTEASTERPLTMT